MTKQQQAAFDHPRMVAEECSDERFRKLVDPGAGSVWSVILTMNVGLE